MTTFDNFIFDSQFGFLRETDRLKTNYSQTTNDFITQIAGLQACLKSEPWDSETFHKNVGRLLWIENRVNSDATFAGILNGVKHFDCCYVRLNSAHTFCQFAEKNKLQLMSSKVSQHTELRTQHYEKASDVLHFTDLATGKKNAVLQQILRLSGESFMHNRFRSDPHFSEEQINIIYNQWILNEVKNATSQLYMILENNQVVSFLLYKENISPLKEYTIGFVSLIASDPAVKGKNYASQLLNHVFAKAKLNGTAYVVANTETKNETAIRFFSKNNFKITANLNEYHIWN